MVEKTMTLKMNTQKTLEQNIADQTRLSIQQLSINPKRQMF